MILSDERPAGFFVLRERGDHRWLDQLQLRPAAQAKGLGHRGMRHLQGQAAALRKPVKLMALNQSPANGFYLSRCSDMPDHEEFDNHYIWTEPNR